jgi:hypothetical protein
VTATHGDVPAASGAPRRLPDRHGTRVSFDHDKRTLSLEITLVGSIDSKRCRKTTALELLHGYLPHHELGRYPSGASIPLLVE